MIIVHRNKDIGMGGYVLEGDTVMGIHCRNSREVATAIDHYMGSGTDYDKPCYRFDNQKCPLCRSIQRRKKNKKVS